MMKSMVEQIARLILAAVLAFLNSSAYFVKASQATPIVLSEEYFSGGTADNVWSSPPGGRYSDSLAEVSDPNTPGGDSWAGKLADRDANFYGIAMLYAGQHSWTDVVLVPTGASVYSILGNITFYGGSPNAIATLSACLDNTDVVVATATTQLGSGDYILANLPPGTYDIVGTAAGYHTDRSTLTDLEIIDHALTGQNIVLYPPEYKVFHGNLHSHTSYSDGVQTPADAYAFAQDVAKIDFLAVTDHHKQLTPAEFSDIRAQAANFTQDDVFVGLAGYEWDSWYPGHTNVFEMDYLIMTSELNAFYSELAASGCSATFNHPGPTYGDFYGFAYSNIGDQGMCLVEVRNSDEQAEYFQALDNGWHIGADGSQDNHGANWGLGPTWTGLLATSLTRGKILDAMASHRSFSTRDRNFELVLLANGHWMGETFTAPSGPVIFVIKAFDPDAGDRISQLQLFEDGVEIASVSPSREAYTWTLVVSAPSFNVEHYYLVKATQGDGNSAWSAPVWITFTESTSVGPVWQMYE